MGTVIPLSDASRRPTRFPVVTLLIISLNVFVFVLELIGREPFVLKWAAIPADIVAGHRWITILTAMFMHGSWSHIIGNMVFLWAFGPEIEDAMNPLRYAAFYLLGGLAAMVAQVIATPASTVPNLGATGAIAAVMGAFLVTYPRDRIRALLWIFILCASHVYPGRAFDWRLVSTTTLECWCGGNWWRSVLGTRRWVCLWSGYRPAL